MESFFFQNWVGPARALIVGALAYTSIVVLIRVSGKRTLSQWNAFDFIVTVALGSILATIITSQNVPLLEGMLAFAVLIGCQYIITWLSVRSGAVRGLVKNRPTLLLYEGEFLHDAMIRERVSAPEIRTALRSQGIGSVAGVGAVVLETNGQFSVIQDLGQGTSALEDVRGFADARS